MYWRWQASTQSWYRTANMVAGGSAGEQDSQLNGLAFTLASLIKSSSRRLVASAASAASKRIRRGQAGRRVAKAAQLRQGCAAECSQSK